jgi:integrase
MIQHRNALTVTDGLSNVTFNFAALLPGRASSIHTQRAYYRWIDLYLADVAGLKSTDGVARYTRMSALPVRVLLDSLSAPQLRAWLGKLVKEGHGKQGLTQARAAIVTLGSLMAEAGLLDDYTGFALKNVRQPSAEEGQRPGRWLSTSHLKLLIASAREIATSDNQALRNHVILAILCTMALRREELAAARWGDLSLQNDRVVMWVHGKGRKVAMIDMPRPLLLLLDRWRQLVEPTAPVPPPESALIRRIWKGGGVSQGGLTTDGVWFIVSEAAKRANLGNVTPHDLRRSVAGALHDAGTPIDKISRLLRHANVAVTERYLNRLPKSNEGAILMSELIGLEPTDEPDWVE